MTTIRFMVLLSSIFLLSFFTNTVFCMDELDLKSLEYELKNQKHIILPLDPDQEDDKNHDFYAFTSGIGFTLKLKDKTLESDGKITLILPKEAALPFSITEENYQFIKDDSIHIYTKNYLGKQSQKIKHFSYLYPTICTIGDIVISRPTDGFFILNPVVSELENGQIVVSTPTETLVSLKDKETRKLMEPWNSKAILLMVDTENYNEAKRMFNLLGENAEFKGKFKDSEFYGNFQGFA